MTIEQREFDFRSKVNLMIAFPYAMRKEFIDYWSEPSHGGKKLKFEMEKTWDLKRRLERWQRSNNDKTMAYQKTQPEGPAVTIQEVLELDKLLERYRLHPTEIAFNEFGKWYDYLKGEKLLRPFNKTEIENLRNIYGNDNQKCRCACVQMTLDGYVNSGITFADIFRLRMRLA